MLPKHWRPAQHALARIGSLHDGGYFVSPLALQRSTALLSLGLSDDWSFEADFRARNPVPLLCLDHTVTPRFWIRRAIASLFTLQPRGLVRYFAYRRFFRGDAEHRRLCAGYDIPGGISLARVIEGIESDAIFLKCDIEGSEYRLFDDIVRHARRFTGMVIEFHSIDLHRERIDRFLAALTGFRIVALHPNNAGGMDANGDPLVIEITLTRSDLVGPTAIDRQLASINEPARPDIEARFEEDRHDAA